MSNDITYSELVLIKSNINEFNNKLEEIAISLGDQITKEEKDFYI